MAKRKRKWTPEEIAERREFERRSDENLKRLRELVERGWNELEERRAREGRELRIPRP
jgi:hypothetical protein